MLISTNLSLLEISNIYTTRLYSRLLGNFKLFKFYGDDVRIKLNISKKALILMRKSKSLS